MTSASSAFLLCDGIGWDVFRYTHGSIARSGVPLIILVRRDPVALVAPITVNGCKVGALGALSLHVWFLWGLYWSLTSYTKVIQNIHYALQNELQDFS